MANKNFDIEPWRAIIDIGLAKANLTPSAPGGANTRKVPLFLETATSSNKVNVAMDKATSTPRGLAQATLQRPVDGPAAPAAPSTSTSSNIPLPSESEAMECIASHTIVPTSYAAAAALPSGVATTTTAGLTRPPADQHQLTKRKRVSGGNFQGSLDCPSTSGTPPTNTSRKFLPPIVFQSPGNWNNFSRSLSTGLVGPYELRLKSGNTFHLKTSTPEDFQKTKNFLRQAGVAFHSFTPKGETDVKVVLKGLPHAFPAADVASALQEQGFKPSFVRPLKGRNGRGLDMFLVQFPRSEMSESIYAITNLMFVTVKIEAFRTRPGTVAQCFKCQRFGHSSINCGHAARCVKCSEEHLANECPRERNSSTVQPKCCNCKGEHTANYGGCSAHKNAQKRKKQFNKKLLPGAVELSGAHKPQPTKAGNAPGAQQSVPKQDSRVPAATKQGPKKKATKPTTKGTTPLVKAVKNTAPTKKAVKPVVDKVARPLGNVASSLQRDVSQDSTRLNKPAEPSSHTSPWEIVLTLLKREDILTWLQPIFLKLAQAKNMSDVMSILLQAFTTFMTLV
jgi:hypothetical protein